jgi:hypothetical protein
VDHVDEVRKNAAQSWANMKAMLDPEHPNPQQALAELTKLKTMKPDVESTGQQIAKLVSSVTNVNKDAKEAAGLLPQYEALLDKIADEITNLETQRQAFADLQRSVVAVLEGLRPSVRDVDQNQLTNDIVTVQIGEAASPLIQTGRAAVTSGKGNLENWRKNITPSKECAQVLAPGLMSAINTKITEVSDLIAKAEKAYANRPTCHWPGGKFPPGGGVLNEPLTVTSNFSCVHGETYTTGDSDWEWTARAISAPSHGTLTPRGLTGWVYKSAKNYKGADRFSVILTSKNKKTNATKTSTAAYAVTVKEPYPLD